MSQQANVTQIDAIKHFRSVLVQYQAQMRDACELLNYEGGRGVDWVDVDRSSYWPAEVRRLEEALGAAKNALEQCNLRAYGDERASCIDEKKAVTRINSRLNLAREKVKQTRSWKMRIQRDGDEFQTRIVQVTDYADADLPKAIAALDRMIAALEQYAARSETPPASATASGVKSPPSGEGAGDSA